MNILTPVAGVSPLRQRLIDEMEIRRFGRDTQRNYIRAADYPLPNECEPMSEVG